MDVTECENCGGIVVFDAHAEAVQCVFCGDVSLTTRQLADAPQPTEAVPFDVTPDDAQGLFRTWARSSLWAPKALRSQSATVERVWIPAWRVQAEVEASWTGLVDAKTKSGKRPKSGAQTEPREAWVPASLGLSQEELLDLAPFPHDARVAWAADTIPYEVGGLSARGATSQARALFEAAVRSDLIRAKRLRDCRTSLILHDAEATPLMLPVFIGCVRFRDRAWRFVVNGQTGRVTGTLPIDRRKVALAVSLVVAVVLAYLLWR